MIDRGLIGLLIVLFGWQVSGSLERYKLVETERVADSSQFVAACSEMWAKAYEFERYVNQAIELKTRAWMLTALRKDGQLLRVEIAERDKQLASMRFSATAAREHAISIIP